MHSHMIQPHKPSLFSPATGSSSNSLADANKATDVFFYGTESNHLVDMERMIRYILLITAVFPANKFIFRIIFR